MRNSDHTFHFIFLLAGVVVSLILLSSGINHVFFSSKVENGNLELQTYEYGSGYGYRIFLGEDVLIQQDHIPSLEHNRTFCSRGQAERVALVVLQKLQHGANPAISLSELKKLKISFECAE